MKNLDKEMQESIMPAQTANKLCSDVTYDAFHKSKALY